jgi:hypothetical protein
MISKYSLKKNQEQNITERNKLQLKLYSTKKQNTKTNYKKENTLLYCKLTKDTKVLYTKVLHRLVILNGSKET